jgi:hypothetical protein
MRQLLRIERRRRQQAYFRMQIFSQTILDSPDQRRFTAHDGQVAGVARVPGGQRDDSADYSAFLAAVNALRGDALQYLAVGLVGTRKKVGKLVSGLALYA